MSVPAIVLFDGVCNLCNKSVRLIFAADPAGHFRFAPLQSALGRELLTRHSIAPTVDSIVLVDGERAFVRSTAALRIARGMRAPWPLLSVLLVVPAPLRDWVYDRIARSRYRIWGKSDACPLPPPGLRERFLSDTMPAED